MRAATSFGRGSLLLHVLVGGLLLTGASAGAGLVSADPLDAQVTAVSDEDRARVLVEAGERFLAEGEVDVAQALFRYVVEQFGDTSAAARARAALGDSAVMDGGGSGRVELQVWSTLYGLWLGIAVPAAFDADGSEAYGAGLLLGGPAGFLFGSRVAGDRNLSTGQARAITLGGTWGAWQGWGWSDVLDIGDTEICSNFGCSESESSQARLGGAILGGLAGLGAGTLLSRRDISPGLATTVNFGSLWGTWFGIAGGVLMDLEDDAFLASVLIGGDAGLLATAMAHDGWQLSRRRARLISIAGVIGGLAGAGVDLLVKPDDEKVAIAIPLATSIAGLAIGAVASRREPGAGEGVGSSDAGAEDLGALLQRVGGRWSMGLPRPELSPVGLSLPHRDVRVTQWRVPLFRTRF